MKPIFIARAPSNVPSDNIKMAWDHMQDVIAEDYHPFIVMDNSIKEWVFELYNVQNATEAEIEELKEKLLQNIKQT